MKRIKYIFGSILMSIGLTGCIDTFLDLEPLDQRTDVVFFKKASDFEQYSAGFYGQLIGWSCPYGSIYEYMDVSSDLMVYSGFSSDLGHGTIKIPSTDTHWTKNYEFIRSINILFDKASQYEGDQNDIKRYLAEGHFFRANAYFDLLKRFGGVPLILKVLDTDSPELKSPRNSRYEVVNQILADLQTSIEGLPIEQEIPAEDKGRISKWAAMAFKARVLLYEATWRKYNQTEGKLKVDTDFLGSAEPEKDQIREFLEESVALNKEVIEKGGYSIWNHNNNGSMSNQSSYFLFNLEDASCNPAGYTKADNNEFILYSVYDVTLRPGNVNLTHTVDGLIKPSRKLMDMFLCKDGLPISKSNLFRGYKNLYEEYIDRDLRMINYVCDGSPDAPVAPTQNPALNSGTVSGYSCAKFANWNQTRTQLMESANYPIIRLAEVYLNYAEAYCELNGRLDDEQLKGINELRDRAGVAHLSEQLITSNGLDWMTEIRRERTIELFMEGFRFDDLKRWGIAENELNMSRCGAVVGSADYPTAYVDATGNATSLYQRNIYPFGEEDVEITTVNGTRKYRCVVLDGASGFQFSKQHYLWPIPQQEIDRNPNLVQNPGY